MFQFSIEMKSFLAVPLLFIVFRVINPEEDTQYLTEAGLCLHELNLDSNHVQEFISQSDENEALPENNDKFNAFVACYLQKKGYQNEDGEIDLKLFIQPIVERFGGNYDAEELNAYIAEETIKFCKNVPAGNSNGQTAVRMFNCLKHNIKELAKPAK